MARHLMAVCVVCLLCADHLPCKQHFEETTNTQGFIPDLNSVSIADQRFVDTLHLPNGNQRHFEHSPYLVNKRRGRTKRSVTPSEETNDNDITGRRQLRRQIPDTSSVLDGDAVLRVKRHSGGHHHNDEHDEDNHQPAEYFVRELFKRFGDADSETMNVMQFERMMYKLDMYNLIEKDQTNVDKTSSSNNKSAQCISSTEFVKRISSQEPSSMVHPPSVASQISSGAPLNTSHSTAPASNQPADAADVLLNARDLAAICPILLYQLTANNSMSKAGCIDPQLIAHNFGSNKHVDKAEVHQDRTLVWVYAIGAILLASLCGLLAVVVIPCMESKYYHYLLQFFVALGVGTLAGDALLHLLPHAMMPTSKDEDPHVTMTLKGLVAAAGIVFFFVTERALTMIAEWRKRKQKKDKPSSRVRVMREPDTVSVHDPKSEKLCKAKYSSYPYCYDEIDMDTKDDHHHHTNNEPSAALNGAAAAAAPPSPLIGSPKKHNHNHNHHHNHNNHNNHNHNILKSDYKSHDDFDYVNSIAPLNYSVSDNYVPLQLSKRENGGGDAACHGDHTALALATTEYSASKALPETTENYTIILREHEAKHHGHSHTHGHVHSPPSSMSAVAWMVIMGDGLHNFTDGMAIGAAFSNNIPGGFSTALAVFCHELPHELGDFAILLKAGMSARQAVYYNVLSSVLSFIGTVLGIWIGDTPEASSWIFACAAGMFLYIAMVDMMPELTSSHKEESFAFTQLLLQVVGMLLGMGIMLLIATYENDLKLIFDNTSSLEAHH